MQKHLFIIDPPAHLNRELDTSLCLMAALEKAGAKAFWTQADLISWQAGNVPYADVYEWQEQLAGGEAYRLPLSEFTAIHIRKEPPFDIKYLALTWCLESLQTHIFNKPRAIRDYNEKLSIFNFPQFLAPALLSSNYEEINQFLHKQCKGDGICKPLDSFGGRGVERLQTSQANYQQRLNEICASPHLIQPFAEEIFTEGEVRAFTIAGKPLAWCRKQPKAGEFLANTAAGAKLLPHEPTEKEFLMVEEIAKQLNSVGLCFLGFDLIAGRVSEINVTSPRLLKSPGDSRDYFQEITNYLLDECSRKPKQPHSGS